MPNALTAMEDIINEHNVSLLWEYKYEPQEVKQDSNCISSSI